MCSQVTCLNACLLQAFDDCTTVPSTFKLLESFEGLLDRDAISRDLERKHLDLVSGQAGCYRFLLMSEHPSKDLLAAVHVIWHSSLAS